jgi:hypothetical protein
MWERETYFFADYNVGVIWAMSVGARTVEIEEFARAALPASCR